MRCEVFGHIARWISIHYMNILRLSVILIKTYYFSECRRNYYAIESYKTYNAISTRVARSVVKHELTQLYYILS
jgi:hypothetical protein